MQTNVSVYISRCIKRRYDVSPDSFATCDNFFHRPYRTISHRSLASKTSTSQNHVRGHHLVGHLRNRTFGQILPDRQLVDCFVSPSDYFAFGFRSVILSPWISPLREIGMFECWLVFYRYSLSILSILYAPYASFMQIVCILSILSIITRQNKKRLLVLWKYFINNHAPCCF